SDIQVVAPPVGGGFGGKVSLLEPLLVLLARHVGRPTRLGLTRTEGFLVGRGRTPASCACATPAARATRARTDRAGRGSAWSSAWRLPAATRCTRLRPLL